MFSRPGSELFVPDGTPTVAALGRTTHLGIGAHADDLEIMAIHGILECYEATERFFTGVTVTDGAGSPGGDALRSRDELVAQRKSEQKRAAELGRYGAHVFLDHTSDGVKAGTADVVEDLCSLLLQTRPRVVYTHALTDRHDTHVAVALRVLAACQALPGTERPERILGCEVWRDLDWLAASDKIALPVDDHEELQLALVSVFASQIDSGKRYDRAALGRRHAHAVFSESHHSDRHSAIVWAMDLTPLSLPGSEPAAYAERLIRSLESDVMTRLARLSH
jgi:LmbE family N-acetylglucosaminyl deacetylase